MAANPFSCVDAAAAGACAQQPQQAAQQAPQPAPSSSAAAAASSGETAAAAVAAAARQPAPTAAATAALRVGIACSAETVLHEDNWRLLEAFTSAGHEARIVVWNDPAIGSWSVFDCVVVRTCWTLDVSTRDTLLDWLRRVDQETVLVNPYEVIAWNTEHRFLDELEARGLNVVPSAFVARDEPLSAVLDAMEQHDWSEALVLPAILPEEVTQVFVVTAPLSPGSSPPLPPQQAPPPSTQQQQQQQQQQQEQQEAHEQEDASAMAASAVASALAHNAQKNLWLQRVGQLRQQVGDVLVRPFLRSVLRDGQVSFVFLGGMFSHCVRRLPGRDELAKSQTLTLPFAEPFVPSDNALFFAISAYTALAATIRESCGRTVAPVFARIDVVRDEPTDTYFVNSVELVDPILFFAKAADAAKTFVSAVATYVRSAAAVRRRPPSAPLFQQPRSVPQAPAAAAATAAATVTRRRMESWSATSSPLAPLSPLLGGSGPGTPISVPSFTAHPLAAAAHTSLFAVPPPRQAAAAPAPDPMALFPH